jgi:hypothetical protein
LAQLSPGTYVADPVQHAYMRSDQQDGGWPAARRLLGGAASLIWRHRRSRPDGLAVWSPTSLVGLSSPRQRELVQALPHASMAPSLVIALGPTGSALWLWSAWRSQRLPLSAARPQRSPPALCFWRPLSSASASGGLAPPPPPPSWFAILPRDRSRMAWGGGHSPSRSAPSAWRPSPSGARGAWARSLTLASVWWP